MGYTWRKKITTYIPMNPNNLSKQKTPFDLKSELQSLQNYLYEKNTTCL